jgi:beta-lactamase superfamily II metal-dependent hydrolase
MNLHVVQAEYGNCLILESGTGKNSITVLIDGGLYQTFEKHLKPTLQKLPIHGKLDLVVLSHIDNGSGDDIMETVRRNAMLDKQGKIHVDVLKVPHHGSDRNVLPEFFNTVIADYFTSYPKMDH